MPETNTLSHTTWNCKYHVVFVPKYRRKVFYAQKRLEIGHILRELCRWKEYEEDSRIYSKPIKSG